MATNSSTLAWKIPWMEEPGSLQLCPTLCDPRDGSPLGSSVPGILQARILEWVAMPSSRGSSQHDGPGKPVGRWKLVRSWEVLSLQSGHVEQSNQGPLEFLEGFPLD